jgi:hypothetical protein
MRDLLRRSIGKLAYNVFALGAVADFGAKNFQHTTKADARHTLELTTKTAIEPNACYSQCFLKRIINF